jgi:hypothetical protein
MLATMRWAHDTAEAAHAQAAVLLGKDAVDAAKVVAGLRALARDAAKNAAPYMHARLAPLKRDGKPGVAHEDALAALDDAVRDGGDARAASEGVAEGTRCAGMK